MAHPPGSCPHRAHPWTCPAVKALQDAVDLSEADWRELKSILPGLAGKGVGYPAAFRLYYDIAHDYAIDCIAEIEDNRVEAF